MNSNHSEFEHFPPVINHLFQPDICHLGTMLMPSINGLTLPLRKGSFPKNKTKKPVVPPPLLAPNNFGTAPNST